MANGANVGNAVLKFDLEGNYLGEYPGWFNFPHDITVGGDDQVDRYIRYIDIRILDYRYGETLDVYLSDDRFRRA